jgi:hypothetical protein
VPPVIKLNTFIAKSFVFLRVGSEKLSFSLFHYNEERGQKRGGDNYYCIFGTLLHEHVR